MEDAEQAPHIHPSALLRYKARIFLVISFIVGVRVTVDIPIFISWGRRSCHPGYASRACYHLSDTLVDMWG